MPDRMPVTTASDSTPATEARRALAAISTADFSKIRDPKLRDTARKTIGVLEALASNTSTDREATLMAELDHAIVDLKVAIRGAGIVSNACDHQFDVCGQIGGWPGFCNFAYASCLMMAIWEYNRPKN